MEKKDFILSYTDKLKKLLDSVDVNAISQIIDLLEDTQNKKGVVYVLGNGGSSATASHMANDLNVGLKRRNIRKFNVVSLADNSPVVTAISNDIGYENIFYMQLLDVLKPEDIIIAISCSGNSPNITKAVDYAKTVGSKVVSCTGFDGGELRKKSDICFHVDTPKGEYGLVEDMHMILDHIIYSYYISLGSQA
ncbi:MAG: SIS domain-containing protein [Arcobacteraceae bacterium]|jgi:D-sedoheptulose 7-phosphate isomerase|nr:SIS domain-containing protein [Arcobacteraceae bacterium]